MKIELLGWQYQNIRKFEDMEIVLQGSHGEIIPITAIMMRNGTGKTTTLMLLRAIFSGSAINWSSELVRSYRPLNHEVHEGKFSAKVRYTKEDGTSKIYRYILCLDFEGGCAYYETSFPERHGGLESGHSLPPSLQGVIDHEQFVNRFIFDGEQARKTLSSGNKEAEEALVYLYQLNKIDDLNAKIHEVVLIRQESSQNKSKQSVKIHKTRMEKALENWNKLFYKDQELRKSLKTKSLEKNNLESRFRDIIAADDELKTKQEKLANSQAELDVEIQASNRAILNEMRKPYNLHPLLDSRLKTLASNMVALKLPKSTSQEFFEELALTADVCICNRPLGAAQRIAIRKNAKKYLGEEQLGILNAIKHTIREYQASDGIEELIRQLSAQKDELDEVNSGLVRLALQAEKKGHVEIANIRKQIDELERVIGSLEEECRRLETKDYIKYPELDESRNIEKARKKYEEERKKYEKVTDTYRFSQQAEKMSAYLKTIRQQSLEKLKKYMVESTNQKIHKIITNDQITIKGIDQHILLSDREHVSAGQELSVAYAYIGTLFEHAHHEFPFIIDSPAGSMDLEMGREVADILPELFKQLIIFVTSREVPGFAETFFDRNDVRYLTIIEQDGKIQQKEGQEFFSKYQVEDEGGR